LTKSQTADCPARIVAFRPDKAPREIDTVQTLRAMLARQAGEL